ncbi:S8 family serine peptidase [Catenuloplanes japonicus]|uniref:S8 family serine peptidase n=1 Tax=Catenuloplanes japonicus TaxID=33876 RepID=UPI00068D02D4|nr:S8 family serine peptidase [Catenuloplanes japonicus]
MLTGIAVATLAAVTVVSAPGSASAARPDNRTIPGGVRTSNDSSVIKDSYIVVLKSTAADGTVGALAKKYGGTVERTFTRALKGFSVTASAEQAGKLAAAPEVAYVEQNRTISKSADTTQLNVPSWGLDRLDQIFAPLNKRYTYPNTASNVRAYVIDSGIRVSHTEFGGRASNGYDFVDNDAVANDCDGHGTHVAGTIGGTTYGVAKEVGLVGVRVLDCQGLGTVANAIAGVEWVTANAVKPAVVNMSLGVEASDALDAAVNASIASGLSYSVAAGNNWDNACDYSPSRVPDAITVGATDEVDYRTSDSNFGSCVDIFAPGNHIPSSVATSDTAIGKLSGTSMASPHVAGAAALALSANPALTPVQVRNALVFGGTRRVVRNVAAYAGTADVILRIGTNVVPQVTGLRSLTNGKNVSVGANGNSPLQPLSAPATMGDLEKFTTAAAGTGYITFGSWVNGRYVSATNAGNGPLIANATTVTDAERFQPVTNSDGTVSLISKLNGKYVTVPNSGNSPLIASATTIGGAEKFIWASPSAVVVLRAAVNDKIVTAPNNAATALIASSTTTAPANPEKFDMLDLGADRVAFRSQANRQYVTSPSNGVQPLIANSTTAGDPQTFYYYHLGDGSLAFQTVVTGNLWQAADNGNSPLIANFPPLDPTSYPQTRFYYEVLKVG